MVDRTVTLAGDDRCVFDEDTGILYAAGAGGVTRWDAATGAFLTPIPLTGGLSGLALSPDGRFLIVGSTEIDTSGGGRSAQLHRVDLQTLDAGVISVPLTDSYEGAVASVAISASGQVLFSTQYLGSGWTALRTFDVADPAAVMSLVAGIQQVRGGTTLLSSPNGEYIAILEGGVTGAPTSVYSDQVRQVTAGASVSFQGFYGEGRGDISNDGHVVVVTYGSITVHDATMAQIADLSAMQYPGHYTDGQFSEDGRHLFLMNQVTDRIEVYETAGWTLIGEVDPGVDVTRLGLFDPRGAMDLVGDGSLLLLPTDSGLRVVDLASRLAPTINGTAGADVLYGTVGVDTLNGEGGDDSLSGGANGDILNGLGGADTLNGGAGGDVLNGGDGIDTVSYAGSGTGVYVRLFNNTAFGGDAGGDTLSGIENASGSSFNDDLRGSSGVNVLDGAAGDDYLEGQGGNDTLLGGLGADTLVGGAGGDTLNGGDGIDSLSYVGSSLAVYVRLFNNTAFGGDANGDVISNVENATGSSFNDDLMGSNAANVLTGGAGNDLIRGLAGNDTLVGGTGGDTLDGGDGVDTISYVGSALAVYVRLFNNTVFGGDANGDVISNVENATGSSNNDDLMGSYGDNMLNGGAGNDRIQGLAGNDTLVGGAGGDTLNGGDGVDTISYAGSALAVYVRLFNSTVFGGDANGDVISNIENATGSSNNDDLMGSQGANALDGGAGNDLLRGLGGADALTGGAGNDTLTGGDGVDRFVFSGASGTDTITDFVAGVGAGEVIQLSGSVFTDYADLLAHTNDDGLGNTVISKSGVQITLTGVLESQLTADDFVFSASSPAAASAVWQALPTLAASSGADLWSAAVVHDPQVSAEPDLGLSGLGLERHHLFAAPSDYDWVW